MLLADISDKYVDYLENPKSKVSVREQLDWFLAFTGRKIKVSAVRVNDVTQFLKTREHSDFVGLGSVLENCLIPYAAKSETSSNVWNLSVISVFSCSAWIVGRPSRVCWMAA
jgi:hypothetical protein